MIKTEPLIGKKTFTLGGITFEAPASPDRAYCLAVAEIVLRESESDRIAQLMFEYHTTHGLRGVRGTAEEIINSEEYRKEFESRRNDIADLLENRFKELETIS